MCHAIFCLGAALGEVVELPEGVISQQINFQLYLTLDNGQAHILAVPNHLEGFCRAERTPQLYPIEMSTNMSSSHTTQTSNLASLAAQEMQPVLVLSMNPNIRQMYLQASLLPCRYHLRVWQYLPDLSLKHNCLSPSGI